MTRVTGEAKATVTLSVGKAEAEVIQLKTNAVGAGNYASIQIADSFGKAGIKLVPDVMVAGGDGTRGGTIVDALLGNILAKGLADAATQTAKPVAASKPSET